MIGDRASEFLAEVKKNYFTKYWQQNEYIEKLKNFLTFTNIRELPTPHN